jgi:voltage-gated sodium channel
MKWFVNAFTSEKVVVSVILLNALALFMVGFTEDRSPHQAFLFTVDYFCVVYFIVEATLKIHRLTWRGYWSDSWNRFDFTVVVLSLPVLLSPFIDTQAVGVVLVLRLGRLFRLFRLLRFIPNREHMAVGVKRALRASIGVLLALILVNIILAIGATLLFKRHAPEHFANPFASCYSIFKVCTVEGWYEIPDEIMEHSREKGNSPMWGVMARIYFIGSVLVMGIIGLSLANAIFIDEMTSDNTHAVERKVDELHQEIRALREELRKDKSG